MTTEQLQRRACEMRKNPTQSEHLAAEAMKKSGLKYESQKVLGFYILDFLVPSKCLVVEIDGRSHDDKAYKDCFRDSFINQCGFRVVRVSASEAKNVMEYINKYPDADNYIYRNKRAFAIAKERKGLSDKKTSGSGKKLKNLQRVS